jgi:hypothetical protein
MEEKMNSTEYLKTLDRTLIEVLSEIIVEENKTSRLIKKTSSNDFIEDLCQIIDNHSDYWVEGEKK